MIINYNHIVFVLQPWGRRAHWFHGHISWTLRRCLRFCQKQRLEQQGQPEKDVSRGGGGRHIRWCDEHPQPGGPGSRLLCACPGVRRTPPFSHRHTMNVSVWMGWGDAVKHGCEFHHRKRFLSAALYKSTHLSKSKWFLICLLHTLTVSINRPSSVFSF